MSEINIAALQAQSRVGEGGITETSMMTHLAFNERLTLDEDIALEVALPTNPPLRAALRRFEIAKEVNVALEATQQFVGLLATTLRVGEPEGGATIVPLARIPALLAPKPITERGAINPITGYVTP